MNYHCIAHQNDRRFFHKTMTVQKIVSGRKQEVRSWYSKA